MGKDLGGAIIAMKAKDQRGNLSPSRGRPWRRKHKGENFSSSLSVAPECHREGNHCHGDRLHEHHHPHLFYAVHSPTPRCNPFLNMVLYATYYDPMMCCHLMMFWVDILCLWVDWWSRLVCVVWFILVLSYCALHVAQAWGIPAVGCCNMSMVYLLSVLLEWQKHKHG